MINPEVSTPAQPHWVNRLVIFVCVFLFTNALVANGVIPIPAFYLRVGMAIIAIALIAFDFRHFMRIAFLDWSLIALVFLTVLSTLWSIDRALTFQRAISLVTATLLGYYIASRYTLQEQIRLYLRVIALVLLLSLVFVFVLPELGVHSVGLHQGRWRGVFTHKNDLGRVAALGGALYLFLPGYLLKGLALVKIPVLPLRLCLVGLSLLILFFAESASALVVMVLLVILTPTYFALRFSRLLRLAAAHIGIGIILLFSLLFITNTEQFLHFLGRDETFTGRTLTWEVVIDVASRRPLTGYGFAAGFTENSPTVTEDYRVWIPSHAHNEWLDVLLELGVFGVALLLYNVMSKLILAIRASKEDGFRDWLFIYIFLLYFLLLSMGEVAAFRRRDYTWIIYVSTTLMLLKQYIVPWFNRYIKSWQLSQVEPLPDNPVTNHP